MRTKRKKEKRFIIRTNEVEVRLFVRSKHDVVSLKLL